MNVRRMGKTVILLALFLLLFHEAAASSPPQVLLINSYHKGYAWTDTEVTGIEERLQQALPDGLLFVEYLDSKRIPPSTSTPAFTALLAAKYTHRIPDLVMVTDDNAFNLVLAGHLPFLSGVPTVFAGVNHFDPSSLVHHPAITGLEQRVDLEATITTALSLHPHTSHIAIIGDAGATGQAYLQQALRLRPRFSAIDFQLLDGRELTTSRMLKRLKALPHDSLVLLCIWVVDCEGRYTASETIYPRISAHSPVPVYGVLETMIGQGIVGGKVMSGKQHGAAAAELALQILGGRAPADIPVQSSAGGSFIFDYRQLQRWNIPLRHLPPGSDIRYRPVSFFSRYRGRILSSLAVMLALLVATIVMGSNIVHRRRIEQKLRRTSDTLGSILFSSSAYAICATDLDLVFIHYNPAAASLFGIAEEAVQGRALPDTSLQDRLFPRGLERVCGAVKEQGRYDFDFDIQREGESPGYGHGTVMPMRNREGETTGYLLFALETTPLRTLEQRLLQSQKMEAIGTLANGIAHDFNNILGAIAGYVALARQDVEKASTLNRYLGCIDQAIQRARDLTSQILTFSRQTPSRKGRCNLTEVVTEALQLLRVTLPTTVTLLFHPPDSEAWVLANETQIHQVVINLCTNATHAIQAAGRAGTITLAIDRSMPPEPGPASEINMKMSGYYCLTVTDDGCGMSPAISRRALEPYFTTKENGQGTGMGLATVHGIVKEHGGFLTLHSREGSGTTIVVFFPAEAPGTGA